MKIEFDIEDISDLEYIFTLIGYGALCAISSQSISIYDAERVIFAPRVTDSLRKIGCDQKLIDAIDQGCYLEDYEDLLPERLVLEVDRQKNELSNILRSTSKKVDPIRQITFIQGGDKIEFFLKKNN